MNAQYDINQIRNLLNKYYEAETTPAEEALLEAFFSDTPDCDIPADIADDTLLFSKLNELRPQLPEPEIPDNLLDMIEERANNSTIISAFNIKTRNHRYSIYSGVAAIACIIILVGSIIYIHRSPTQLPEISTQKPTQYSAKNTDVSLPIDNEKPSIAQETTSQPISVNSKNIRKITADKTPKQPEKEADGFIEITDPAEVERIALEIEKLLAQSSEKTSDAISHIGNTIEDYKELTKTILQ